MLYREIRRGMGRIDCELIGGKDWRRNKQHKPQQHTQTYPHL
jgi:hypothetical protein